MNTPEIQERRSPKRLKQDFMRMVVRRFWGTLFTIIIAVAVCVQLGREAFPLLNDYRTEISRQLSGTLGVDIKIGEVAASWKGLTPKLNLIDVTVSNKDTAVFKIKRASAELSLLDSIADWRFSWRRIAFDQFETTLTQDEAGHWGVAGIASKPSASGEPGFNIDDPLDVFLFGRRIDITDVKINLEFRTGHNTQLVVPKVSLENDRDFHRLLAELNVDDEAEAFSLVVEGIGDPRNKETFHAKGYIALNQFPMEKVLAAVGADFWQSDEELAWKEGHRLDLSAWFEGNTEKGISFKGMLISDGLPVKLPEDVHLPQLVQSRVTGKWHGQEGWEFVLQNLGILWEHQQAPELAVKIYGNRAGEVGFLVDEINVADWMQTAQGMGLYRGKVGEVLSALNPRGTLKNVDVRLRSKEQGYFQLNAIAEDAAVDVYQGVPNLEHVNGFVSADAFGGFVNVDSRDGFVLNLPRIYEKPILFDSAHGQVAWSIDVENKLTYINSGLLEVKAKSPEGDQTETARGYLFLKLPFKRDLGEAEMVLSLGLNASNASSHRRYVPKVVPQALYRWLDKSIQGGDIKNVGFLYSGSVMKDPEVRPTIQVFGDVENATLKFAPEWPALEKINAHLFVDNADLTVQVTQAEMQGNHISGAVIDLVKANDGKGHGLRIVGAITGNAAAAMKLLNDSPIRAAIGTAFDQWQVDGDVSAAISLLVPINKEFGAGSHKVSVGFENADIVMPDLNLRVLDISGALGYESGRGVFSDGLAGKVWGNKVNATIKSVAKGERAGTHIKFDGKVNSADILKWTSRPELHFVEGISPVSGSLYIPSKNTQQYSLEVAVATALKGTAITLPKPLGKQKAEEKKLAINIKIFPDRQEYKFDFEEWVAFDFTRNNTGLEGMRLSFAEPRKPISAGFFDVSGKVNEFDLEAWNEAKNDYFNYLSQVNVAEGNSHSSAESFMPVRMDLAVDTCTLGGLGITDLRVTGLGSSDKWRLHLDSDFLRGQVTVFNSDKPVTMDLDYLHFPVLEDVAEQGAEPEPGLNTEEQASRESVLAGIDLSRAIAIDFVTRDFALGDASYGAWQFELRPVEHGIELNNIRADVRGMSLVSLAQKVDDLQTQVSANNVNTADNQAADGTEPTREGARFIWLQNAQGQQSFFDGQIRANNIADVLAAWGQEKMFNSESVVLNLRTQWDGAPDQVTLGSVQGLISFDMRNGNFIRGAEAGENPLLRLLALFNFDTIARRLQLDFSDLAKQGFAYDRVYGELDFANGEIVLETPLVVESTSSKVQWAGTINMLDETLDTEMVVTLPVAGNLAVATAFVMGLPAGLGVYVVGKLFKKQVDKVSSINYGVTGDWEDPKIKVRRIFNDSAAKNKGQSVKKEAASESTN